MKQKLIIFFHTQHFNYLDFVTCNVLFLVCDLIFEIFPSILTSFAQKLGEINPQIHTTDIFYGQKPYKHHFCDWEVCCLNTNNNKSPSTVIEK